jgi:hypothetical protein
MRLASTATINADGTVTTKVTLAATPHLERVTPAMVATPNQLAPLLTRIVATISTIGRCVFAMRRSQTICFEGITCGTAGSKISIPHGLGVLARWNVARWYDPHGSTTTSGHSLVQDESSDTNTLVLRSYVAGCADIEVH